MVPVARPVRGNSSGSLRRTATWTAFRPQSVVVCEPIPPSSHSNRRCLQQGQSTLPSRPATLSWRKVQSQTSIMIRSRLSASVAPVRSLIASTASSEAITATAGPRTPAVSQVGCHAGGRSRLDQAAKAGRLARDDRHRLSLAADHSAVNPGLAQLDRDVVDQVAGFEIVGAVENQVGVADEIDRVGVIEVRDDGLDLDRAVDQPELPRGGLGLGEIVPDVLLVEEDLPLQIVQSR